MTIVEGTIKWKELAQCHILVFVAALGSCREFTKHFLFFNCWVSRKKNIPAIGESLH